MMEENSHLEDFQTEAVPRMKLPHLLNPLLETQHFLCKNDFDVEYQLALSRRPFIHALRNIVILQHYGKVAVQAFKCTKYFCC